MENSLDYDTKIRSLKHMFIDTKTGKFGFYDECGQDFEERYDTLKECIEKFDEYVDHISKEISEEEFSKICEKAKIIADKYNRASSIPDIFEKGIYWERLDALRRTLSKKNRQRLMTFLFD